MGDKCKNIGDLTGRQYTHKAEISCFTPIEYVYLMNAIDALSEHAIDSVILTSEDAAFINMVVSVMKNESYSNVSHWNIVLNTEDFSVGEGTTTFQKTLSKFASNDTLSDESV